ncbi:MAG: mechanosensitive ion channel family protein [Acidobacteriota bacterium]
MAEKAAELAPSLILALLVFVVFYLIYWVVKTIVARIAKHVGLERTVSSFLLIALKYVILIFGAITALQQVGINVTSLIAGLGIIGLSLGFAAKDTLSNIIAGVFLFWDKPFIIGDLIEVSDEYGQVHEITLRTTRIVTPDGKLVSIPNSELINSKIKSYTMYPHLRLDIDVTIGVNEDIGKARDVILGLLQSDNRLLADPAPAVLVTTLGDYFVGLQLRVWLDEVRQHVSVKAELRERIKEALDRAKISMPFETIEVIQPKQSEIEVAPSANREQR